MDIQACELFSTRLLRKPSSDAEPLVQLVVQLVKAGADTDPLLDVGKPIKGAYLETQFRVSGIGYLLFLTDDVPFEETLRVYLLDEQCALLDGLEFAGNLATGNLEGVRIVDTSTIEFSFIHLYPCRVMVHAQPGWRTPLIFTPGVSRWGRIQKRYLELTFVK